MPRPQDPTLDEGELEELPALDGDDSPVEIDEEVLEEGEGGPDDAEASELGDETLDSFDDEGGDADESLDVGEDDLDLADEGGADDGDGLGADLHADVAAADGGEEDFGAEGTTDALDLSTGALPELDGDDDSAGEGAAEGVIALRTSPLPPWDDVIWHRVVVGGDGLTALACRDGWVVAAGAALFAIAPDDSPRRGAPRLAVVSALSSEAASLAIEPAPPHRVAVATADGVAIVSTRGTRPAPKLLRGARVAELVWTTGRVGSQLLARTLTGSLVRSSAPHSAWEEVGAPELVSLAADDDGAVAGLGVVEGTAFALLSDDGGGTFRVRELGTPEGDVLDVGSARICVAGGTVAVAEPGAQGALVVRGDDAPVWVEGTAGVLRMVIAGQAMFAVLTRADGRPHLAKVTSDAGATLIAEMGGPPEGAASAVSALVWDGSRGALWAIEGGVLVMFSPAKPEISR